MTALVGYMLVFLAVGVFFIFFHLMLGKLIRPAKPDPEKKTIYECGEPTIGSAWIQFDLRYYVVALLFVIFDVEVAFFFPWAVVFGQVNTVANETLPPGQREAAFTALTDQELGGGSEAPTRISEELAPYRQPASQMAWVAFFDILVFFGVLLVGFVYLWKRGDIAWVRSTAAEQVAATASPVEPAPGRQDLVGAGSER